VTCVAALKHEGRIYMGADSAGVGGYALHLRADPKIYRNGPMLIGFTSSFRMGQLLGNSLKVPDHDPRTDTYKWMCTEFIDAVRECLKKGGYAKKENEVESGGTFLVGYQGRIFIVDSDHQVGEWLDEFTAVGCGADIAIGSLYSTPHQQPQDRIELAIKAAERFSAGVRGPIRQQTLP
jgi:ATP-dependent protease HslVU (ClpYQ) peptidase subunit